ARAHAPLLGERGAPAGQPGAEKPERTTGGDRMSHLPELRASLVRAAAREVAAPPRRSRFAWLAPTFAAAVALAVVAVAVVLVGHGHGGSPPTGGGASSVGSNGAPPPQ